jgi:hypothetical protein
MRIPILFCFLAFARMLPGQAPTYFQQEVHYRIAATLDDEKHQLSGEVVVEYINHSPDTLPSLWFHLWANAFGDRNSAFAEQQLRMGKSKFYFAKDSDLGGYETIDFQVNGETLSWAFDPAHPDIARVDLPLPMLPGERLELTIPFLLQVPASFSRLGHVDQSYQFTQWYPKPAVYDRSGWHPMPYLDMGEFYSEFGSFDVSITLPANYVVAATGELQTAEERDFLRQKAAETRQWLEESPPQQESLAEATKKDTFPPSEAEWKTIRYTADRVHDFAWFADKRFRVLEGGVELASGRRIDTWAFFTYIESWLWKDAIDYLNRSVRFYSDLVGEYPYPQATAVMSALSAGGGMEYPMITVIGTSSDPKALDNVITHEVGHNWFYGILASNERDHPWMDEGINTYYEHRYMESVYGGDLLSDFLPDFLAPGLEASMGELGYLFQARRHRDQAPDTHSDEFRDINYWLGAYEKPGWAFRNLEGYLGREAFDRAMQAYYREWQFRHPQPGDLRRLLERETGRDLGWLFDGYISSNAKIDYAISRPENRGDSILVTVKNRQRLAPPFAIYGLKDSLTVASRWYEGFSGKQTVAFPAGDYDRLSIDQERYMLDLHRHNNAVRTAGFPARSRPLRLGLFTGVDRPGRTNLYLLPLLGWNNYNKLMAGLGLHNYSPIQKTVEWHAFPMFSFVTQGVNGLAGLRFNLYPGIGFLPDWTLSLDGRHFAMDYNRANAYYLNFYRLSPSLRVRLRSAPSGTMRHYLRYRLLFTGEEAALFDTLGAYSGEKEWENRRIHLWSYELENNRAVNPHALYLNLEQQSYTDVFGEDQRYLRLSLDLRGKYTYAQDRHLSGRLFLGYHLTNTLRDAGFIGPGAFNLTAQGYRGSDDYRYDEYYFGRNDARGVWANQVSLRDAGFKNAFSGAFQNQSGNTNNFMIAVNLKADLPQDLPFKLPVKPYFDLAFVSDRQPINAGQPFGEQLWWSGGFSLELIEEMVAIYFPAINSANIRRLYDGDGRAGYWSRITFQFNLREMNPLRILERQNL